MLLLPSFPTQTFTQQTPARRGTGDANGTVLTITCFLLGLGSSSSGEGLKDFPLERGKRIAELKIHHLGTGEPHSGQGAPSSCQQHSVHLPPYLSKPPSRFHLRLPARRDVPGGARTSGSGCSRLGEEASGGSAGEVTLSHRTPPVRATGQDHVTSTWLPSTAACAPPPPSARVLASGEPRICKILGLCRKQPPSPGGPTSRSPTYQKLHPAQPAALGGSLPRPPRLFPPSHPSQA